MVRHRGMGIPMAIARALTFKKEEGREGRKAEPDGKGGGMESDCTGGLSDCRHPSGR